MVCTLFGSARSTNGESEDRMELARGWEKLFGVLVSGPVVLAGLGSGGGAVRLDVRVVLSLTGLLWLRSNVSVTVSELVATDRGKSTTLAAASASRL